MIPARGPFPFGAPYHTLGVRVTNAEDGEIWPRTYSYWSNVNAHRGRDTLRVVLGTSRGPCHWRVDKCTHTVTPLGPLFPPAHPLSASTAEGWYWDAHDCDVLYCSDDQHLYRFNVETRALTTVVDITPLQWGGQYALRQWHSSGTGRHSATVKQVVAAGAWPNVGTIVYDETQAHPWTWVPADGALDESQLDRTGDWLLIKENLNGLDAEDNRIINIGPPTTERLLRDRDGAAGHSDNGYGYMVAADNWQPEATWRVWMFAEDREPQGRVVLAQPWERQVLHVSHANAVPGPPDGQWVLGSGTCDDLITIPLDGSMACRAIAPSMSAGAEYDDLAKANLDPHGLYACWTARREGRFDAFLVQLPGG